MRIGKDIDARSGLLVGGHRSIREQGGDPSASRIDEPLDKRGTATDG
jgi:hypothetical protein